jgi:hypothetical protein
MSSRFPIILKEKFYEHKNAFENAVEYARVFRGYLGRGSYTPNHKYA